jgi:hypothetical protein
MISAWFQKDGARPYISNAVFAFPHGAFKDKSPIESVPLHYLKDFDGH